MKQPSVFPTALVAHYPWVCSAAAPVSSGSFCLSVCPPVSECCHADFPHTPPPSLYPPRWQHPCSGLASRKEEIRRSAPGRGSESGVACQLLPSLLFPAVRFAHVVPALQCPA